MQKLQPPGRCAGMTDDELAGFYASGNDDAFTVLVDRYFGLIRSVTSKYKVSGLEPDDLTQEGLMGLMCAAKSFKTGGGASFRTYAFLCIERRVISLLKRSESGKDKALNDYISIDDESFFKMSGGVNPEDMYIGKEGLNTLDRVISECLSEKERKVLSLYLAGESYDETAMILNTDRKSVDNAMQRIRRKLKKQISGITL